MPLRPAETVQPTAPKFQIKGENSMKRSIGYMTIALMALLPGLPKPAQAQTEVPQAETSAGPALATLGGTTFLAWKGKNSPGSVWYSTLNGSVWSAQHNFTSETNSAPALAVANSTVYLAFKGQQEPSDGIYMTSWNAATSAFPAPSKPNAPVADTATTAAPALAGNGSTLYLAFTTASNSIMFATYAGGSWSSIANTGFSTNTQMGPALTVYNSTLYLAWVEEGSNQIEYATLPLSGGRWSSANQVAGAQTDVAPALGVFDAPATPPGGLYLAWTTAADQLSYASFNGSSASFNPPVPIPPGPLATSSTPALISFAPASCPVGDVGGADYVFSIFFAATNIYFEDLESYQISPCKPSCTGIGCG
jgi:hypothetical protein